MNELPKPVFDTNESSDTVSGQFQSNSASDSFFDTYNKALDGAIKEAEGKSDKKR